MRHRVHGGLVWDRVRVVSVTPHGMSWCESLVETEQDHPVGLAGSMEIPETVGRGVVGPMTSVINAWVIAVELADNILAAGGHTAVGVIHGPWMSRCPRREERQLAKRCHAV